MDCPEIEDHILSPLHRTQLLSCLSLFYSGAPGKVDNGNDMERQDIAQGVIAEINDDDDDDSSSSSSSEDERAVDLESDYEIEENDHVANAAADGRDDADSRPAPVDRPMEVDDEDDEREGSGRMENGKTEVEESIASSIEGLKGLKHKLHFLGLVGMEECEAENIPANKVITS